MFEKGFIKKADIVLFVVLLLLGVGSIALTRIEIKDATVEISVDGKTYMAASLDKDQEIVIDNEYGKNIVVIEDKKVYVKEADCAGQDCVHMNPISKGGQMIMCLPHKLLVSIEEGDGLDSTSY